MTDVKFNEGFTLITFAVYCVLCVSVIVLFTRSLSNFALRFLESSQKTQRIIDITLAIDLLSDDIIYAPHDVSTWHHKGDTHIGWQTDTKIIEWQIINGSLKRSIKQFDKKRNMWKRKHTTTIISNDFVGNFAFVSLPHGQWCIQIDAACKQVSLMRKVVPYGL